jgi:mRNA interferase RelE/StbE
MASYRIEWKRSATKEVRKLPAEAINRILKAVESLSSNPYPPGSRKLVGAERTYRIRVGSYRVIYNVLESTLVVEVIRVAHRKDAYN